MARIGIIGDFNARHHTHTAIDAALDHAREASGEKLRWEWLPTLELAKTSADQLLSEYDAFWAAPASPYRSGAGMLRGIEYARSRNVPFTGT